MEIIVTSIVAVVGTLLGSLATHYFQRRNRADAERFDPRPARHRVELLDLGQRAIDNVDRLVANLSADEYKSIRDTSRTDIFSFVEAARKHVEVA